jgi:hypothetical protein
MSLVMRQGKGKGLCKALDSFYLGIYLGKELSSILFLLRLLLWRPVDG